MQITVKLYATLRRYGPASASGAEFSLDVPANADVAKIVEHLGMPDGVALVAMVNDEVVHLDRTVAPGDRISLFPPVAGG